jgi:hypothetical protein
LAPSFFIFEDKELKVQSLKSRVQRKRTPKISAMENEPRNLRIRTLIRVAHALDSRLEKLWVANQVVLNSKELASRVSRLPDVEGFS